MCGTANKASVTHFQSLVDYVNNGLLGDSVAKRLLVALFWWNVTHMDMMEKKQARRHNFVIMSHVGTTDNNCKGNVNDCQNKSMTTDQYITWKRAHGKRIHPTWSQISTFRHQTNGSLHSGHGPRITRKRWRKKVHLVCYAILNNIWKVTFTFLPEVNKAATKEKMHWTGPSHFAPPTPSPKHT